MTDGSLCRTPAPPPPRADDPSNNGSNNTIRHRKRESERGMRIRVTTSGSEGSGHRDEIAAKGYPCSFFP
jgi:hypothetical protein